MKKLVLTLAFIFAAGTVSGFTADGNLAEADYSKEHVNEHLEEKEIPGFLSTLVDGQTINLHLEAGEQERTVGIEMEGMKVDDTSEGGYEEPKLEVWVEQQDIEALNSAEKPVKELNSRLKQDEIRYESHGMINNVKFTAARTALNIASALGF